MKTILPVVLLALFLTSGGVCKKPVSASFTVTTTLADSKKIIGAHLQVKAEKTDEFLATTKAVIAASRAEPGNISYTLLQDPYDKTAFFFFEEWKSQTAIDEHFATPHFKAFGAQLKDFLTGAPVITIYSCPDEKKVGG